jgi:hypothetical protein
MRCTLQENNCHMSLFFRFVVVVLLLSMSTKCCVSANDGQSSVTINLEQTHVFRADRVNKFDGKNLTKCGSAICQYNEYCCNKSCGVCAPKHGNCHQLFCGKPKGTPRPRFKNRTKKPLPSIGKGKPEQKVIFLGHCNTVSDCRIHPVCAAGTVNCPSVVQCIRHKCVVNRPRHIQPPTP